MGKMILPVSERFYSIQGEGKLAGEPSVFVRFAGCPVRCPWCDTAYAWTTKRSIKMTVDEIVGYVDGFPTRHVVLTGGEPLIHPQVTMLSAQLRRAGTHHVTVETAAVVYRRVECDLLSISPKLPGTVPGRKAFHPDVIRRLIEEAPDYQIKFVVGKLADVCEVMDVLEEHSFLDRDNVMLMPNARNRTAYERIASRIARFALDEGLRFCPRLHLHLDLK